MKDALFQPVRKTQDAKFFIKADDDTWTPSEQSQPGSIQTTMQELASKGLAAKVKKWRINDYWIIFESSNICKCVIIVWV